MSDDNLIVPGQPLESLRRILRQIAADVPAEARRIVFRDKLDPEQRREVERILVAVERVKDALSVEGEE